MKTSQTDESEVLGAETQVHSKDQIKKFLKRDFQSALSLMDGILKEDPLLDYLAEYVYSKIVTRKNQENNPLS